MTSVLPRPEDLERQLDQARGVRDRLDRVIAWLEEGVELLGPDGSAAGLLSAPASAPAPPRPAAERDEPAPTSAENDAAPAEDEVAAEDVRPPAPATPLAPATPPAPPPARRQKQRSRNRSLEAAAVAAVADADGSLSADEIAAACGRAKDDSLRKALQQVVRDGRLKAEGATKARRYSLPDETPAPAPAPEQTGSRAEVVHDDGGAVDDGATDDVIVAELPPEDEVDAAWAELEESRRAPEPSRPDRSKLQEGILASLAREPRDPRVIAHTLVRNVNDIRHELRSLADAGAVRARGDGKFELVPAARSAA